MKLYHGSHIEVRNPKILTSARVGDFGRGFYTTSSLEQARRWAQIRARQEEVSAGIVTVFDVPEHLFTHLELQIGNSDGTAQKTVIPYLSPSRKIISSRHLSSFQVVERGASAERCVPLSSTSVRIINS